MSDGRGVLPPLSLSLLLLALAVPMSAALLAAAAPALEAHAVALEAKYLVGRCIALVALLFVAPLLLALALAVRETHAVRSSFASVASARTARSSTCSSSARCASPTMPASSRSTAPLPVASRASIDALALAGSCGAPRSTSCPSCGTSFAGDMALVGPRPERPEHVERFSADVPGYARRHRVRVGLTGLAQVQGSRGASCIATRAQLDNAYIDEWSAALDLKILGRTVGAVLRGAE